MEVSMAQAEDRLAVRGEQTDRFVFLLDIIELNAVHPNVVVN